MLPDDQPVVRLDASTAYHLLATREQLYSHFLSQASWWVGGGEECKESSLMTPLPRYGGLGVLLQTSPESPDIFRLVLRVARWAIGNAY